jgi:hypothetical protein
VGRDSRLDGEILGKYADLPDLLIADASNGEVDAPMA